MLSVVTSPIMLSVVMLNVIMLNVIMLNVIMLNVIMLSVVAPNKLNIYLSISKAKTTIECWAPIFSPDLQCVTNALAYCTKVLITAKMFLQIGL
jgi:hypothetical protein